VPQLPFANIYCKDGILAETRRQVCTALGRVAPNSDEAAIEWYYASALETQACVGMHLAAQCTALLHQRLLSSGILPARALTLSQAMLVAFQRSDILQTVRCVVAVANGKGGQLARIVREAA